MKPKYFLLGFFALSVLAFSSMVQAQTTYSLGVSVGDKQTYTVVTSNSAYVATQPGSSATMEVTKIDDTTSAWEVTLTVGNDPATFTILKDPSFGAWPLYLCPIPVSDYLSDVADAWNAYSSYIDITATSSGNTWTLEYEGEKWETTFDTTTGWATSIKITDTATDKVTYEIRAGAAGGIPGYEMPILLGISALFTFGLIFLKKKRI